LENLQAVFIPLYLLLMFIVLSTSFHRSTTKGTKKLWGTETQGTGIFPSFI